MCDKDNPTQAPSESQLLWAATVIDCEGCLSIHKTVRNAPYYRPTIHVGNTFFDMIADLYRTFGGDVRPMKKVKPHHKQCYVWRVEGKEALAFLRLIRPYIRYKRGQADAILEFWDELTVFQFLKTGQGRTGTRVTVEEQERRRELYERVKALNQTGAAATTEREDALEWVKRQSELLGDK